MPYLYTVGYEGLDINQFVDVLAACRISAVVDVRELPLSRKPGFSKTKLSESLRRAGIAYESIRALGSPRAMRQELRKTRDWERFAGFYCEYLDEQVTELERLIDQAYDETICLMCFEHESAKCHRSLVADRVVQMATNGLRVRHL